MLVFGLKTQRWSWIIGCVPTPGRPGWTRIFFLEFQPSKVKLVQDKISISLFRFGTWSDRRRSSEFHFETHRWGLNYGSVNTTGEDFRFLVSNGPPRIYFFVVRDIGKDFESKIGECKLSILPRCPQRNGGDQDGQLWTFVLQILCENWFLFKG